MDLQQDSRIFLIFASYWNAREIHCKMTNYLKKLGKKHVHTQTFTF